MNRGRRNENSGASLLTVGIILGVLGIFCGAFFLVLVGVILIVVFILVQRSKKKKTHSAAPQKREKQPSAAKRPQFASASAHSAIEYDAETGRAADREEDHRLHTAPRDVFGGAPHAHDENLMRQARAEIRNLKNIRYARSELTGRTLSDSVIWHSRRGVCSSVVQIIRQGNLRYPDCGDRELSEHILADEDLMRDLVRCLEWEKRTEIRLS